MEPKLNVELIKMYYRATGQGTSLYVTLIKEYINNLDKQDLPNLSNIAPLLLSMVGVCHYDNTQSLTMYQSGNMIIVTLHVSGDEILTLSFSEDWLSVKYPEYGLGMSIKDVDIENEVIGHIIADVGMWNMAPARIKIVVDYLMSVQRLLNPRYEMDILDILENERQDLLDVVTSFDKIIDLYTVKNSDEHYDDLTYSDEQLEDTVNKQSVMSEVDSGLTPDELAENIKVNQARADSIDSELTKSFLDEFSEIADIVKIQTSSPVTVSFKDDYTLTLTHGSGADETVWALVTKPKCPAGTYFMRPATSDIQYIQYLDMTTRETMIESFASIIDVNTGGIVHDACGFNKVVIDDFIKIVLNIMLSNAAPGDIHLPSEETPIDPTESTNDKIKQLATEYTPDITSEFNNNKHVEILDSINYLAHRVNAPKNEYEEGCDNFVDLIARAYAADLVHNSRAHNANTLKRFAHVYIDSLVSINWEPKVLQTLDPSVFRNQPNWVTSYGFDVIIDAITKYWYPHEQLDVGQIEGSSNLIIPMSNATTDIRSHLNNNNVLTEVSSGVTNLSNVNDNGKVTYYRYIRIPAHKDHIGGDTLIVYLEMTSELIRIVPIYTDSKTNKVDSLNVFVSIRETDWPNIALYLDMVLTQTLDDTTGTK